MTEVKKGVEVWIYPKMGQMDLFHMNFGCCHKAHNVVLGKYQEMHEKNLSIQPTFTLLISY